MDRHLKAHLYDIGVRWSPLVHTERADDVAGVHLGPILHTEEARSYRPWICWSIQSILDWKFRRTGVTSPSSVKYSLPQ